ncbi:MAG: hypothetical protein DHS20C15_05440 [Planctomycetota bacterium]|nr:MAG: hypothetical protein DHS20C15_05440 [Planctomycetota bacterium]
MRVLFLLGILFAAQSAPVFAGDTVRVTWTAEVEFNQINPGALGMPVVGESVSLTCLLDSDDFVNSASFPTRGYVIDPDSFELQFESVSVPLKSPFPAGQTPYFVIRDNDPGVDGFFVATDVDVSVGVPLDQVGGFGDFNLVTAVTYGPDAVPSLDLLDALGSYDFSGLQVFSYRIEDGPFDAMGMVFESLSIELESTWTDDGSALPGVAGNPVFAGSGSLLDGAPNQLSLARAAPDAFAALFASIGSTPTAFKGGTLKPLPFGLLLFTNTSPTGRVNLSFNFPAGVPSGTEIYAQWAITDAAAILGVSLSNAVKGTAH